MIFRHKRQYWIVPFVSEGKKIFLKTLYPSRKYKKIYEEGRKNEKN